MSVRRLVGLVGVLVFLALAALMVRKNEAPVELARSPLADADIVRIQVLGVSSMTLVNEAGRWRLSAPVADLAQPQAVESLLSALRGFTYGSVVSENALRHPQFEVNAGSATQLSVFVKGQDAPALDLLLGKRTPAGDGRFVRSANEIAVKTADGLPVRVLAGAPERFRETAVIPFAAENVDGLTATWKGGSVALVKSSDSWKNAVSGGVVPGTVAEAVLSALSGLRAASFADPKPGEKSEFELGVASGTARINVSFGRIDRPAGGDPVRRVLVEGRPSVMLVPEPSGTDLLNYLRSLR